MRIRLKDAFDLQMGKTPARNTPSYWDGDHKWISIADIGSAGKYIATTKERITDKAITESGIRAVPAHTVIMSFKLSIGKTAITSEEMYTNEAIMAFVSKGTYDIDADYLYHLCCGTEWTEGTNKAVMGLTLNKATLSEKRISLPEITEQRNIAAKFDALDNVIEKTQSELSSLDQLVKSRFIEMFGDCIDNPKGWKTKCLEDIAEVGSSKRVFIEELQEAGIPFYRGTEVGALAEGKQISPELFITEEHYTELCKATGTPQIGDLLMPSICPDGRIWVVNTEDPFYFKDGRVLWVHAIDNSYNPVFLLYTLKDRIMADYSSIASGTTFAELKIFALKKCRIFDVPIELQNQFAAFVVQTDKSKFHIQKSLSTSRKLWTLARIDAIMNMDFSTQRSL